jgi:hypothetical protein
MSKDVCSKCGVTKSKIFWDFKDNSVLCDSCNKKFGKDWEKKINQQRLIVFVAIIVFAIILLILISPILLPQKIDNPKITPQIDKCPSCSSDSDWTQCLNGSQTKVTYICNSNTDFKCTQKTITQVCEQTTIEKIKEIAQKYNETHTYSLSDFFVCSDMAIDVWNLIKTAGINAKLCAGRVDSNITGYLENNDFDSFLGKMNHAWVLAETEPFKYLAVEATGGYVVWGENSTTDEQKNDLYYQGAYCFATPSQFKSFSDLRTQYLTICPQAKQMSNYWNEHIAGTQMTFENQEYKGTMQTKIDECTNITNQLIGLLK